ncbi:MAG: PD40 domain-containing protein [Planctomycetes bacterium]|nr:PD40 domain-containing protein [Planctomycetota bacterium]
MTRIMLYCAIALSICNGAVEAAEVGYYSQPALFGDQLVFVSEGDLWTATLGESESGPIVAYRLTSSDGSESHPCFSPDGRMLAFTAEYDGNRDVYLMPIDGGSPTRLTFHPDPDVALGWTPDGRQVLFRSQRTNPLGRWELWRVYAQGGMPIRYEFGECSMATLSSTGRQIAFTRWSNENWTWKRYRGGAAPEIWIGDLTAETFTNVTDNRANDLFPMWVLGRLYFLSDRTGTANIFSDSPRGGDLKQHTAFAPQPDNPTAVEGYDIRWPSTDAQRRGARIAFCQAGGLALFDAANETVRRLDVRLASDRVAKRQRFAELIETATEYALSPDGTRLLVGSRGELLSLPVKSGPAVQFTRTSAAREWGAAYFGEDQIIMISDAAGEQQIAIAPADGSLLPSLVTEDREAWLFPPVGSSNGQWIAFADKTMRLHTLNMVTFVRRQVDASEAAEITDYRFSPDSHWLAYTKPMPNGYGMIFIHSLRTGRSFAVSDGLHDDREPRWDPAGKFLYFLSRRKLNPVLGELDLEHVYFNSTVMCVVPLTADTPPPIPELAHAVDFDIDTWAKGEPGDPVEVDTADEEVEEPPAAEQESEWVMRVDTDGLPQRQFILPIDAGNYRRLEALPGSLCYLSEPVAGLLDFQIGQSGIAEGKATLHRYDLVAEEDNDLAEMISGYVVNAKRDRIAHPSAEGFVVLDPTGAAESEKVDVAETRLRVNIQDEWNHIFEEAWRLQRDFYWAPNFGGVNWSAMRDKYAALLPRIGTRAELTDLIGEMIGELGTSHTYIWGGQPHDRAESVSVGLLGADIAFENGAYRIKHILPRQSWDEALESPLAAPYLGVQAGSVIHAINGQQLTMQTNPYDLLQDQAGKMIQLTIADDPTSRERRTIQIKALSSERPLRYAAWVESNRRYVHEASDGRLGYLHIPNMMGQGLAAFSRYFYPQIEKKALVVDIRNNGGGFVSQMIIQRLGREVWAFTKPRHGRMGRYPAKSLYGHLAVLIDQHAGSDGDIFPESFRLNELGPLIGTRTWGGVVGIRADKPFVDFGLSTQPEFAWWEPKRGWSLENEGVTPDIEVKITPNDRMAGRDPQLDKAIEVLLGKLEDDPKVLPSPPPWPERGR